MRAGCAAFVLLLVAASGRSGELPQRSEKEARQAVLRWRKSGHAGSYLDLRVKNTNRSYSYDMRATLWTPEAIRGGARLIGLREHLTEEEVAKLVEEAEALPQLVVTIEVDPHEGSGIIPTDETFYSLEVPGDEARRGTVSTDGTKLRVFTKWEKRDYAYEQFVVAFPRPDKSGPVRIVVEIAGKREELAFTLP